MGNIGGRPIGKDKQMAKKLGLSVKQVKKLGGWYRLTIMSPDALALMVSLSRKK